MINIKALIKSKDKNIITIVKRLHFFKRYTQSVKLLPHIKNLTFEKIIKLKNYDFF